MDRKRMFRFATLMTVMLSLNSCEINMKPGKKEDAIQYDRTMLQYKIAFLVLDPVKVNEAGKIKDYFKRLDSSAFVCLDTLFVLKKIDQLLNSLEDVMENTSNICCAEYLDKLKSIRDEEKINMKKLTRSFFMKLKVNISQNLPVDVISYNCFIQFYTFKNALVLNKDMWYCPEPFLFFTDDFHDKLWKLSPTFAKTCKNIEDMKVYENLEIDDSSVNGFYILPRKNSEEILKDLQAKAIEEDYKEDYECFKQINEINMNGQATVIFVSAFD